MVNQTVEKVAADLASMNREELVEFLRNLDCSFVVDFTDEYLNSLDVDRLRHVVLATCLHAGDGRRQRAG